MESDDGNDDVHPCSQVLAQRLEGSRPVPKSERKGQVRRQVGQNHCLGTGMWGTYRAEVVASQWAPVGCLSMLFSGVQSRDPAPQQVLDSVTTQRPKNLMSLSSGSKLPLWLVS